jgi:hypothetical protein
VQRQLGQQRFSLCMAQQSRDAAQGGAILSGLEEQHTHMKYRSCELNSFKCRQCHLRTPVSREVGLINTHLF